MNPFTQNEMTQSNQFQVGADETFPQIDFHNLGMHRGSLIDFPDLEHYDFKHGDQTAKLATVILSYQGEEANTPEMLKKVWIAGYFHDIGRRANWRSQDPQCAARSAEITEDIFRAGALWDEAGLQHEVCRLIANNDKRPTDNNPLARALWDADRYETARLVPGTEEGQKLVMRAFGEVTTDWAKDPARLLKHMEFRGWASSSD